MGLLIGLLIGLVLGLTGAGGSLFAVPLLGLGLGLSLVDATGVALGAVAISAVVGVFQRRSVGIVWLPVSIILVGGMLLAPVGRWLAGYLSPQWLLIGFSVMVVWVARRMWLQATQDPVATVEVRAQGREADLSVRPQPLLINGVWPSPIVMKSLAAGVVTGLLSGLLGVGGGFVIVPILTLVVGLTMAQAVASSLLIISCVSTTGFVAHWWLHPGLNLPLLGWVAFGGVMGMWVGGRLSERVAGPRLQQAFAIMMLLTVLLMWLRA